MEIAFPGRIKDFIADQFDAADAGLPEAQYQMGLIYELGLGVLKSISEAQRWFSLAAEQGLPEAILELED